MIAIRYKEHSSLGSALQNIFRLSSHFQWQPSISSRITEIGRWKGTSQDPQLSWSLRADPRATSGFIQPTRQRCWSPAAARAVPRGLAPLSQPQQPSGGLFITLVGPGPTCPVTPAKEQGVTCSSRDRDPAKTSSQVALPALCTVPAFAFPDHT